MPTATMRTPTRRTPTPTTPTATRTPTTRSLQRSLAPVEAGEFLARFWEREPLAVSRSEPERFADLLSVSDAEQLVESGSLRFPAFRLVRASGPIALRDYATDVPWRPTGLTGTADPAAVAAAFADGATIVLQALHHTWTPLARFCRALEAELGHPTQANAYYTPSRSQGFGVHHDTHDVFVLQTAGSKSWRVYAPLLELPLKHQRYSARLGEHGPPTHELTLSAGDTLYLPRGWLHEALTSDEDSLHVTVGVNVHTWLDAARAALEELEGEVELRRAVPPAGGPAPDVPARLAALLEPDRVSARMRRRLRDSRRPVLDGHLAERRALGAIGAGTLLERRPTVIADLEGTTLRFEGRHVVFPPQARAALEAVVEAAGPFCAGDLPDRLDEAGRLVLVRRLVAEGFLRRSAAGA